MNLNDAMSGMIVTVFFQKQPFTFVVCEEVTDSVTQTIVLYPILKCLSMSENFRVHILGDYRNYQSVDPNSIPMISMMTTPLKMLNRGTMFTTEKDTKFIVSSIPAPGIVRCIEIGKMQLIPIQLPVLSMYRTIDEYEPIFDNITLCPNCQHSGLLDCNDNSYYCKTCGFKFTKIFESE